MKRSRPVLAAGVGLLLLSAGAGPAAKTPGKTAVTNARRSPLGPLYGSVALDWTCHNSNSGTDYDDRGRPKVKWTETLNGHLSVTIHLDGKAGERKSPDGRVTVIYAAGTATLAYDETWHIDETYLDPDEPHDEWEEVHSEAVRQPAALGNATGDSHCSAFLIGEFPKPAKGGSDPTAPLEIQCDVTGMRVRTVSKNSRSKEPPKPIEYPLPGISIPGRPEAGLQSWSTLRGKAKKLGDEIRSDGSFSEPTVGHWWESHYIAAGKAGIFTDRPEMAEAIKRMPMLADALKQMQAIAAGTEAKMKSRGPGQRYGNGGPFPGGTLLVTWHVSTEEYEVVVDSVDPGEYETWRPEGSPSKNSGNQLGLRAKLQRRGGRPPELRAKKFLFELEKVSREPGIAMNFPSRGGDTDPDLRFEKTQYPGTRLVDVHGQQAETTGAPQTEGKVLLGSYDWGGWGELKVTALLTNGRKIVGHLKEDVERTQILLPKRKDDSKIADVWKKDHAVEDLPDDDDDEKVPEGDPTSPGDGLTLYEEYRGFYENTKHVEGDPKRKDLFILNKIGPARSEEGLELFSTLTSILTHAELQERELREDRVINGNHAEGKHRVDQHALRMEETLKDLDFACTYGHGGPPGQHDKIVVPLMFCGHVDLADDAKEKQSRVDCWARVVAHELLHGCAVTHHGEGDHKVLWSKRGNQIFETPLAENGHPNGKGWPVVVEDEDGTRVAPDAYKEPLEVWLGVEGGQHSGNMDCVMRYNNATAYPRGSTGPADDFTDLRIRIKGPEPPGIRLCESATATGLAVRRYGDASKKGGCRRQLRISDDRSR